MDFKEWFKGLSIEFQILFIIWFPTIIFILSVFILSLGKPLGLYDWVNGNS